GLRSQGHDLIADALQAAIPIAERRPHMPLSVGQQRLWFLSRIDGASAAYHLSGAQRLRGMLDIAALTRALQQIVARHEALRTRFVVVDGVPMQHVVDEDTLDLRVHDLRGVADRDAVCSAQQTAWFAQPFDLA